MSDLRLVWLPRSVAEQIIACAVDGAPNEAGGVLAGYRSGDEIVVSFASTPGPESTATTMSYEPDPEFDEEAIAREYERSQRRSTYLGDWHSHPGGNSDASKKDLATLLRIARSPRARAPEPIMLIAHGSPPKRLICWAAVRGVIRFRIVKPTIRVF